MRRIRHLDQCDYIIPIAQATGQMLTVNGQSNVLLERTWHKGMRHDYDLSIHAKFNADTMNGIQVRVELMRDGVGAVSSVSSVRLSRVAEGSWSETYLTNVTMTESSLGVFTGSVLQAVLSTNELTGRETYRLDVVAIRRRKTFKKSVWVNHLGVFDSVTHLRHAVERLEIMKVDE